MNKKEFLNFALFWMILSVVPLSIYASWKIYQAHLDFVIRVPHVVIVGFVMSLVVVLVAFFALAIASYVALRLKIKKDEQTRARPTSTIDCYPFVGSRHNQTDVPGLANQTKAPAVA